MATVGKRVSLYETSILKLAYNSQHHATVLPLLKANADCTDINNYQPISNL